MKTRTRFAPSPTGFIHVGGIRTALFAYLVAKQSGGNFVLRLEDTDKKREVEGSGEHIISCLEALSIHSDEGPILGGDFGPYKQSDRLDIYQAWAQELIDAGRAYADPYTSAEIQNFREAAQANKKAFRYRDNRPENPPTWDGTTPLRFKSEPKSYHYHDEVMGDITTSPEIVDDFILMKSDGYPTYNFAHIVDDSEMQISHVIRGQEFISSMANYLALYEALGFEVKSGAQPQPSFSEDSAFPAESSQESSSQRLDESEGNDGRDGAINNPKRNLPIFAHMPHIMNEQGNKKLGKRDGAKDVLDYLRDGFLPETMVSFIATLGWNDGTEQEVFTHDELIEKFSLARVQKSGARFDEKRLLWMNGHFIRELSVNELYNRVENFWPEAAENADENYKKKVLTLAQERLKTLKDLPVLTDYFFTEPKIDSELITNNKQLKKLSNEEISNLLATAHDELSAVDDWNPENIQNTLNQLLEITGQKPGTLFSLIRIATTWAPFSPQLNDTLSLLGREKTLMRLLQASRI